jgi:hypothetical protein
MSKETSPHQIVFDCSCVGKSNDVSIVSSVGETGISNDVVLLSIWGSAGRSNDMFSSDC